MHGGGWLTRRVVGGHLWKFQFLQRIILKFEIQIVGWGQTKHSIANASFSTFWWDVDVALRPFCNFAKEWKKGWKCNEFHIFSLHFSGKIRLDFLLPKFLAGQGPNSSRKLRWNKTHTLLMPQHHDKFKTSCIIFSPQEQNVSPSSFFLQKKWAKI